MDEEEWNEEDSGGGRHGQGEGGNEPMAKKTKLKRRRSGGKDSSSKEPESGRKRAPRWTKEVFFLIVYIYMSRGFLSLARRIKDKFQVPKKH